MKIDFTYYGATDTGRKRTHNEDDYGDVKTDAGHLFVVCDGMGGHAGGEQASRIAVETICEYMKAAVQEEVPAALKEAFSHANKNILDEAANNAALRGMGTTCVALFIKNNGEAHVAHVGDSRCYLYSEPNGLEVYTKDHSYVQFLIEIGDVKPEEAFDHPKKNRVMKALGIEEKVKADVNEEPLKPPPGTSFLLCSDGLNDMLRDHEIEEVLKGNPQPAPAVKHLVEAALEKGGKDNVTVCIVQVTKSDFKANAKESKQGEGSQKPTRSYLKSPLVISASAAFLGAMILAMLYFTPNEESINDSNKENHILEDSASIQNEEVPEDSSGIIQERDTAAAQALPDSNKTD